MPRSVLSIVALLLLASCKDQPASETRIDNATIALNEGHDSHETEDAPSAAHGTAPATRANGIPAPFHGRWALVPGDCGPDAGVAKGLLTITGDMLRFYESVGKPASLSHTGPDRVEGRFFFSGEGMDWSKDLTLSLKGDKLVRSEHEPDASYTYTRCPA